MQASTTMALKLLASLSLWVHKRHLLEPTEQPLNDIAFSVLGLVEQPWQTGSRFTRESRSVLGSRSSGTTDHFADRHWLADPNKVGQVRVGGTSGVDGVR